MSRLLDGSMLKTRRNTGKHRGSCLLPLCRLHQRQRSTRYAGDKTKNPCAQRTQHLLILFPCAPPRSDVSERRFRRALMKLLAIRLSWQTTPAKSLVMFESRSGARGVRPARSSCAAPPTGSGRTA